MLTMIQFYMPDNDVLRVIGRIVIRHGHLDHVLRLTIKSLLKISVSDPIYSKETRGMSGELRKKIKRLARSKVSTTHAVALNELTTLLDRAERLTELRNLLVHAVWGQEGTAAPMLHDKDKTWAAPTTDQLKEIETEIEEVRKRLNFSRRASSALMSS